MRSISCPGCGATCRFALATPGEIACPACGLRSPTPPAVAAELASAASLLGSLDVRQRQLDEPQRRGLVTARRVGRVYLALLALLAGPLAGMAALGAYRASQGRYSALAYFGAPLIAFVAGGLVGRRILGGPRRRLEAACAATPPLAPGGPAGCRVCGGAIAPSSVQAIARCPFCASDNLVGPSGGARADEHDEHDARSLQEVVVSRARAVTEASSGGALLLVSALVVPIALMAATLLAITALASVERPPLPLSYATLEVEAGRCVGLVSTRSDGSRHVELGRLRGGGRDVGASVKLATFGADALVGKQIEGFFGAKIRGKVVKAFHAPLDGLNQLRVRREDGSTEDLELPHGGVCLME